MRELVGFAILCNVEFTVISHGKGAATVFAACVGCVPTTAVRSFFGGLSGRVAACSGFGGLF